MFYIEEYVAEKKRVVEAFLQEYMPKEHEASATLHDAMRYSVFSGGKRLRPIMCIAASEAVSGRHKDTLRVAAAIEILHTYTLIHDDLPAMDDDDLRRGKPTLHKQYDEATAILAGDALLTLSFEWLAMCDPSEPYTVSDLVRELAVAAGSKGIITGQMEDLVVGESDIDRKVLETIFYNKTARICEASVAMGAITVGASTEQLIGLREYGKNIGLAFQLVDDILDHDVATRVYTSEEINEQLIKYRGEAGKALKRLPGDTQPLQSIADFIISRAH